MSNEAIITRGGLLEVQPLGVDGGAVPKGSDTTLPGVTILGGEATEGFGATPGWVSNTAPPSNPSAIIDRTLVPASAAGGESVETPYEALWQERQNTL